MPQYPNARISFGDILVALEQQLLADGVVEDASQVTWGTPLNVPLLTSQFDVLLVARNATHIPFDGGACDLRLHRMIDIFYRSLSVKDPGGGYKSWLTSTFVKADAILNSVGNDLWWPTDVFGNLLLIESAKLIGDSSPEYPTPGAMFGDWVGTIEANYFPAIDPTKTS